MELCERDRKSEEKLNDAYVEVAGEEDQDYVDDGPDELLLLRPALGEGCSIICTLAAVVLSV